MAFEGFAGGVFVAAGDVNGDGFDDLLVVAGQGGNGHVKVFDGHSGALLASFFSFPGASAEVQGTLADLDGDNQSEIVVGCAGQVRVFNLDGSERWRFSPYAGYSGELSLAAGDVDGDGRDEVFTAACNGHVKVFGADQSERFSFLPYAGYSGAVHLSCGDVNGDKRDDVLTTAVPSAHVKAFSGLDLALLDSFFARVGKAGVSPA
jgi:hypothetical protein